MTDNTPRPSEHSEPMSREQVLSVIDNAASLHEENDLSDQGLRAASAAVTALYERCEALERVVRNAVAWADNPESASSDSITKWVDAARSILPTDYAGTQPSDAEGGG